MYFLIGYPGVGKHTVAFAMVKEADRGSSRLVLVDNHYIKQPDLRNRDPSRAQRLKWWDPEGLRRVMEDRGHLRPEHPSLLVLDISQLSPGEAGNLILIRGREISAGDL